MAYGCKECSKTFENEREANTHELETGHRVELLVASTYWGSHLIAH